MNRIKFMSLLALSSLFLFSCGDNSHATNADIQDIVVEKQDSAIYRLGYRHGRRMLERCTSTDMLRNELLDVRARQSLIKARMRPEAANAYIQGFRHSIQESGDTLAETLFGE